MGTSSADVPQTQRSSLFKLISLPMFHNSYLVHPQQMMISILTVFFLAQPSSQSEGELWLGLEKVHQLTSENSCSLRITLKDFDDKTYVAVYDQFQVGPGDDYTLTVGGFNDDLSTLGDSMIKSSRSKYTLNEMKFSTKDRDKDGLSSFSCAKSGTGGWWYNGCTVAHLTGQTTKERTTLADLKQIYYYYGGERNS